MHYYTDFKVPPPFGSLMPRGVGYYSKAGLMVLYGQKTPGDIQRQLHLGFVPVIPDGIRDLVTAALQARGLPHPSVIAPKVLAKMEKALDPIQERIAQIMKMPPHSPSPVKKPFVRKEAPPKPEPKPRHLEMECCARVFRDGRWLTPIYLCGICEEIRMATRHHLAPKQMVSMGFAEDRGIVWICRLCHDLVHIHFTNYQLLNTHWPDVVDKVREEINLAPILADQKKLRAKLASVPSYVKKQEAKIKQLQERSALGIRPKRR